MVYNGFSRCSQMSTVLEWFPVSGYEDKYCINFKGQIKRIGSGHGSKNGRILKQTIAKNGYRVVNLWKNNKGKTYYVHRLIAETFIKGDRSLSVNHKDGDKLNNNVENLEFVSLRDNTLHQHVTGLANAKTQFKPTKVPLRDRPLIAKRVANGEKSFDIAKEYNCSQALIQWIVRRPSALSPNDSSG